MNEEDLEQFLKDQAEQLTSKFSKSGKGDQEMVSEFTQEL
jgi:hypothetical protein